MLTVVFADLNRSPGKGSAAVQDARNVVRTIFGRSWPEAGRNTVVASLGHHGEGASGSEKHIDLDLFNLKALIVEVCKIQIPILHFIFVTAFDEYVPQSSPTTQVSDPWHFAASVELLSDISRLLLVPVETRHASQTIHGVNWRPSSP